MPKERVIDLQLIKPITLGSPSAKGKIPLKKLFKEELAKLQVPFIDSCCPNFESDARFSLGASKVGGTLLYQLPANFASSSIEDNTITTIDTVPTPTPVGPYDQFIADPATSTTFGTSGVYIKLNKVFITSNNVTYRLRVKVDSIGTTNPIIGFYNPAARLGSDYDGFLRTCIFDLKNYTNGGTGDAVINRLPTTVGLEANTSTYEDFTTASGGIGTSPVFISDGDIIEIVWTLDMNNAIEVFTMKNISTGAYVEGGHGISDTSLFSLHAVWSYVNNPGFIFSDGTYTILDYKVESLVARFPKVGIIGDSMGRGSRIYGKDTINYKLNKLIPNQISNNANGGAYIFNMQRAQMQDILEIRPQVVFLFHFVQLISQDFISTDGGYAAYIDAWTKINDAIVGMGSIPVFIKMPLWPDAISQATMDAWYAFVDAQAILYPTALILDLRSFNFTYDSTGYHFNGDDNTIVAREMFKLLYDNNLL